ncbi:MAG: glycosyltransferase [Methylomonas sp.]|jgi:glycosyltransferase involved in cell wall biosynthesis
MKILFIHQNFPGQFKHLAPALAARGHQVSALTMRPNIGSEWQNVRILPYQPTRSSTPNIHPWVVDLETKIIRAESVFLQANLLKVQGYTPDLIIAHPGWGESLFIKEIWPQAKLAIYCEFYYSIFGGDVGFDPEFPSADNADVCRLKIKNLNNHMHFEFADAGISPTYWQASTFPEPFRSQITVIHDGIDTDAIMPNSNVSLTFADGLTINKNDEIITFVSRNLEPHRGYHIFMRALPEILRRRPNARILIIGNNDVSYGARPEAGQTWKDIFINEVSRQITVSDWGRVHFLGNVPYRDFIPILQLSTLHVYLTYPFVLSWSLLEAMSAGCAILASNTEPLHEVITDRQTGQLVDFFDIPALVDHACALLDNPQQRQYLGENARAFVRQNYDLNSICLPKQLAWVDSL